MSSEEHDWVPEVCTLPTVERPLRVAEFDRLLATALRGQERLSPTVLRWRIDAAGETAARELAAQESSCCSFFSFTFTDDGEGVRLEVQVPPAYVNVLDALAARAAAGSARRSLTSGWAAAPDR